MGGRMLEPFSVQHRLQWETNGSLDLPFASRNRRSREGSDGKVFGEEEEEVEEVSRKSLTVPSYFVCPISLEIMQDPVTLCTGQTYDRENILKWLQAGHRSCPATGQRLHTLELIPNHMLRNLIKEWSRLKVWTLDVPVAKPVVVMDVGQVDVLLQQIRDAPMKHEAVRRLRQLASKNSKYRAPIAQQGAISVLAWLIDSLAEAEMEAVRASRRADAARGVEQEPSSPDDAAAGQAGRSSQRISPCSCSSARVPEIVEHMEPAEIQSRSASWSPMRREPQEDVDSGENNGTGSFCFPRGRRKYLVKFGLQQSSLSAVVCWKDSRRPMPVPAADASSTADIVLETEVRPASSSSQAPAVREEASPDSVPAVFSGTVDAMQPSEADKDALLACEEAFTLFNLLPLADDDRQRIVAMTNRGISISWFLRSDSPLSIKINALRLLKNVLHLEELRQLVGSRHSIFIRLLRFVRHDLHAEGLKLVLEILCLICGHAAPSDRKAIEAGTIEILLNFLDSETLTIVDSRPKLSPLIDNRRQLSGSKTSRHLKLSMDTISSVHSFQLIDNTVASAIAADLKVEVQKFGGAGPRADDTRMNKERAIIVVDKLVLGNAEAGLGAVARLKAGIPTLVWHMGKISLRATEICVSTLRALCATDSSTYDVDLARQAAIEAGAINQLVLVVQSGCTPRTRQCAAQLLKILKWKQNSHSPS